MSSKLLFLLLLFSDGVYDAAGRGLPRIYEDPTLDVNCLNEVDIRYIVQPHTCESIIVRTLNGECYQGLDAPNIIHLVPRIDTPLVVVFCKKVDAKVVYLFTKKFKVYNDYNPNLQLVGVDSFSIGTLLYGSGMGGCYIDSIEPQRVFLEADEILARNHPLDAYYRFDSVTVSLFDSWEDSLLCIPTIKSHTYYGTNEFDLNPQLPDTIAFYPDYLKPDIFIVLLVSVTRRAFDGKEYPFQECYHYWLQNCP